MKKESAMVRSSIYAMLVLGLLVCSAAPLRAGKTVTLTPSGGSALKVAVGEKEQTYYTLTPSGRLHVKVDGPGKLTVMSRLFLPAGVKGAKAYAVRVMEKGSVLSTQKTETEQSDATVKTTGEKLGKLRKLRVSIPQGSHVLEVGLEEPGNASVAVKLQFDAGKKKKANQVSLQARSYSRVATAVVKEKLLTYYVSAKDRGVQLRVIGPTRLKVTTRLNYDASMKGGQKYGVGVWEGEKRILLKSLVTSKALAAMYQDWKDVVPGKAAIFSMPVSSGEHYYYFKLEEGSGKSLSLRFSIPKKDLKNEQ
jgi:hypothetical protein